MGSRFLAIAAIGLACALAAGGGAYLAVRQGQSTSQAAQALTPSTNSQLPGSVNTPASGSSTAAPAAPQAVESGAAPALTASTKAEERRADKPGTNSMPAHGKNSRAWAATPPAETESTAGAQSDQAGTRPAGSAAGDAPAAGQAAVPLVVPPMPAPASEPQREFVDVTVPAESVLGLQVLTAVSSETAKVEDRVEARVTRDVRVNDRIAIPAGSQVLGSVVQVDRGGKVRDRAHFAIRFHTLILPDGSRTSVTAEALHREGPSPANKSAAKIGGATVGGAILGAILGGGKGAAIGSGIGAAGGTAATMAGDRQPATLAAGSMVNVRLMAPLAVTLER